jgi:hypothetical protein
MDRARSGKQLMPGHLWMKKSRRAVLGYDYVRRAGVWARNILGERNRRSRCDRDSRLQLLGVARVEWQAFFAVTGMQFLPEEPAVNFSDKPVLNFRS